MKYKIIFDPDAQSDLLAAADYIAQGAPRNAERWYRGIHEAIFSLSSMPERCAFARENETYPEEIRQLLYKSHRVVFTIQKDIVYILRVFHVAQEGLKPGDD